MDQEKILSKEGQRRLIPYGMYCYTPMGYDHETGKLNTSVCPFWSRHPDMPDQQSGYCSYLEMGDWMANGTSLLWDMVKECGINEGTLQDP